MNDKENLYKFLSMCFIEKEKDRINSAYGSALKTDGRKSHIARSAYEIYNIMTENMENEDFNFLFAYDTSDKDVMAKSSCSNSFVNDVIKGILESNNNGIFLHVLFSDVLNYILQNNSIFCNSTKKLIKEFCYSYLKDYIFSNPVDEEKCNDTE